MYSWASGLRALVHGPTSLFLWLSVSFEKWSVLAYGLRGVCHVWDDFHQIRSTVCVVLKPTYITKRKNNSKTFNGLQWLSLVVDKTKQILQLQTLPPSDNYQDTNSLIYKTVLLPDPFSACRYNINCQSNVA